MAIQTKDQTKAAAMASMDALVTAANTKWREEAAIAITNATAQGKFSVGLFLTPHVSIKDTVDYFRALGYQIFVPPTQHEYSAYYFGYGWYGFEPNLYFDGYLWNDWFANKNFCTCKNPCQLIISWR